MEKDMVTIDTSGKDHFPNSKFKLDDLVSFVSVDTNILARGVIGTINYNSEEDKYYYSIYSPIETKVVFFAIKDIPEELLSK